MQNESRDREHPSNSISHNTADAKYHNQAPWKKAAASLSLVLLGSGMTLAGGYMAGHPRQVSESASNLAVSRVNAAPPLPATTDPNFVTQVVQKVGPAVVRIDSSRTVKTQIPDEFSNDPFFQRFFGSQIPEQQQNRVERGTGSGFIISADGRILTNAHVVDGADTVTVTVKDGRTFTGKVLGKDELTDVAVVKIQADNLPIVALGNSDQLQPGEWAIAIGNPLGLDNTVTTGIISATGRNSNLIGAPDKRVEYIQTDAAINPGNSGGPLLNSRGEVIAMNTAIIQGAQGLGFAIPINTAQRISSQLIATGKVEHPYLGIQMVGLTPQLKQNINSDPNSGLSVNEDKGVLVVKVVPNSPAAKAGIRAGDVIQKLGGQAVTDASSVQRAVENSQVGGDLRMELRRNGQSLNIAVQPGAFPAQVQ
ncbi:MULTISPECIES: HhoA/HhoB/HtrA family serine endopeptidase [unclassified Nostoc]|uniref:HhoA/HhoB/HtrA family serine endopeptidase n=1 Tax=unclassified Nostoc TaxID=2593658 RepID=UPI002AD55380|nr:MULTISPECIES: HhoA/HhoB/HtrA family serine endopeptidase [unclassified Nostoc]MDZ8125144.1 HhoA/HhoB/HtrA family serine endopeptidase [Nostoc sp. CmiVER01]MDZ8226685.1 HhoA/HhoB/HtrA family serine endopeptidase [Nostoc sp. ChiVER01]